MIKFWRRTFPILCFFAYFIYSLARHMLSGRCSSLADSVGCSPILALFHPVNVLSSVVFSLIIGLIALAIGFLISLIFVPREPRPF